MAEIKITRLDFPLVFERQTTEVHKIVVTRFKGFILEMEDFHFLFDSAVMLPDYDVAEAAANYITALTVFATGLAHTRKFSTRKTMVASHTDTSGAADYNVKLSQQASPTSASARTRSKTISRSSNGPINRKTIPANPAPSTTATATAPPPPLRTSRRPITPSSPALSLSPPPAIKPPGKPSSICTTKPSPSFFPPTSMASPPIAPPCNGSTQAAKP